jgi:AcrR family transcriptional regulator
VSSSRLKIIDATRQLVGTQGAGVGMSDVARAAGVSRQAVYLHFASRAGLLLAVVRQMDDEAGIRERCEQALADPDPVEALRGFILAWLRYAATIQPMASALLASRRTDPDASAAWDDRMAELRSGFDHVTRRLAKAGRLRGGLAPGAAADLAWSLTSVPVWDQLTTDCGRKPAQAERLLTDAVINAITT